MDCHIINFFKNDTDAPTWMDHYRYATFVCQPSSLTVPLGEQKKYKISFHPLNEHGCVHRKQLVTG
jgi:hypothetical protein